MKNVFSTIIVILVFLLLITPIVIVAEYKNRIDELEARVTTLEWELERNSQHTRINAQDIQVMNNIIFEKDFVKTLD
jgi:predicted Holliday junction resolvase-like endonuclease